MKSSEHNILFFFSVILIALFVKIFIFDILFVSGPSMQPTLHTGSFIMEFKLAWGIPVPFHNRYLVRWGTPKTGDIVIYPLLGRYVTKRCIATEGTPLVFSEKTGYSVQIGDRTVPLTPDQYQKLRHADKVPEGMFFALGDNPAESRDSRDYGFVSLDSIRGKVLCR